MLAGLQSGQHLDLASRERFAEAQLAQGEHARLILHVNRRHLATAHDGCLRDGHLAGATDHEMHARMHAGDDVRDSGRQPDAYLRDMRRRVGRRQNRDARRIDPLAEFGKLDPRLADRAHLCQAILRDAGRDAQTVRGVEGQQRLAGDGHFTQLGQALGDDSGHRCAHRRMPDADRGLSLRRLRRVEIGFRLVHRRLADEALLPQAQHPLILGPGVDILCRRTGGQLARFTGVDLHQQITLFHRLSGVDMDLDDPAGNLRRQRCLIDRLDECFGRQGQFDGMRLHHPVRQRLCVHGKRSRCRQTGKESRPRFHARKEGVCHVHKHSLIDWRRQSFASVCRVNFAAT